MAELTLRKKRQGGFKRMGFSADVGDLTLLSTCRFMLLRLGKHGFEFALEG